MKLQNLSESKVIKGYNGYYIGRMYHDYQLNEWLPYCRESDFYPTKEAAEEELLKINEDIRVERADKLGHVVKENVSY